MPKIVRHVRRTILIVGEGYAEVALLKHIRGQYLTRSDNVELRIKNARGKGGRRVLQHASTPRVREGFDVVAILVDTDQDWDDGQRAVARTKSVHVLESTPCLEAWLLAVHGHPNTGSSAVHKREFLRQFGSVAHDARVYERHFGKPQLDSARARVRVLSQLLDLLGA